MPVNPKVEFAERVFPYLVHNMLEIGDEQCKTVLSQQFRGFFNHSNGSNVIHSETGSPSPSMIPSTTNSGGICGGRQKFQ